MATIRATRFSVNDEKIAEKFIQYYWRQAAPYPTALNARFLRQNTGKQAAIINLVRNVRAEHGDSLAAIMRLRAWKTLVRDVARVVRVMPLWKLQTVGQQRLEFLYANIEGSAGVELEPGVAYCFRKFHALISDLVRAAWARYVRQQNLDFLGETMDLNEFLFGSERSGLAAVPPVLMDIQNGTCFYCGSALRAGSTEVDHFVSWSRYPIDLGHNFVLADRACNNKKRELLPAADHLAAWTERNGKFGEQIGSALAERGIVADVGASYPVARWAYSQAEAASALIWLRRDELVPLTPNWRDLLRA